MIFAAPYAALTTTSPQAARFGHQGLQLVVDDVEAARDELSGRGLEVSEFHDFPWGRFVFFTHPDGNGWAVQ